MKWGKCGFTHLDNHETTLWTISLPWIESLLFNIFIFQLNQSHGQFLNTHVLVVRNGRCLNSKKKSADKATN